MSERESKVDKSLRRVEKALEFAMRGLDDLLKGPPERKMPGLVAAVRNGHSIIFALRRIKREPSMTKEWFSVKEKEMESDALMRYFRALRDANTHQFCIPTAISLPAQGLGPGFVAGYAGPAPPNHTECYIRYVEGENGWECGWIRELPDGSYRRTGAKVPASDLRDAKLHFARLINEDSRKKWDYIDPPKEHLGKSISDASVENLTKLYIEYMANLVRQARVEFSDAGGVS